MKYMRTLEKFTYAVYFVDGTIYKGGVYSLLPHILWPYSTKEIKCIAKSKNKHGVMIRL